MLASTSVSPDLYRVQLQALRRRVELLECELHAVRDALSHLTADTPETDKPAWREQWRVTMLGRFRLERGGVEAPTCSSKRGRSILKLLLATRGHAILQPVLIETFWPGAAPGTGAHNVQMAVHALRRSLVGWGPGGSDDAIMFRQDTYLLHPDLAIEQDVDRFQQAYASGERALAEHDVDAAREAFEQARASYGGEFLSDSPYEDWAAEQRAALQDMHLDVLAQLARVYAAAADWDRASGCCRELLAADPYREDACRDLMRCEAARGRRAEVRDVFETCERRLRRDLQVAPAAETRRLYRALLSGDSDP